MVFKVINFSEIFQNINKNLLVLTKGLENLLEFGNPGKEIKNYIYFDHEFNGSKQNTNMFTLYENFDDFSNASSKIFY